MAKYGNYKLRDKQPVEADAKESAVRRMDPAKRSRAAAPVKTAKPAPSGAPRPADKAAPAARSSQRNHRFDGKLHDEPRGSHENNQPRKNSPPQESGLADRAASAPRSRATSPAKIGDEPERDTPRRGGKVRDGFEPGHFNKDRASNPMFSPKPVASNPDFPRLSKRMAELGLCSRREADEWIANGWVKVDGVVTDTCNS